MPPSVDLQSEPTSSKPSSSSSKPGLFSRGLLNTPKNLRRNSDEADLPFGTSTKRSSWKNRANKWQWLFHRKDSSANKDHSSEQHNNNAGSSSRDSSTSSNKSHKKRHSAHNASCPDISSASSLDSPPANVNAVSASSPSHAPLHALLNNSSLVARRQPLVHNVEQFLDRPLTPPLDADVTYQAFERPGDDEGELLEVVVMEDFTSVEC